MKKKLHPGAKWLFRIKGFFSLVGIVFFFGIFLTAFLSIAVPRVGGVYGIITAIVLSFVFAEVYANLTYDRWFYELTPDSLKIERGIIWKRYSNIPYVKIQNVDINRGILARLFGFSTISIQTAGYSYGQQRGFAEGNLPALSIQEAEKIRDFLVKKASKGKGL